MKQILSILLILSLLFRYDLVMAANTHSIDLELGDSNALSVTDTVSLSITGDISFEAWVKWETLPSNTGGNVQSMMVSKYRSSDGQRAYQFYVASDDKLVVSYTSNGASGATNNHISDSTVATTTGVWVHYAVTIDVSTKTEVMYVYGEVIGSSLFTNNGHTSIADTNAETTVGAYNVGQTFFLDGKLDEVRVWSDIRTSTEIADNYNIETTDTGNLEAYWKLNNDALDDTANDNDLTLGGSPLPSFSTDVPFTGAPPAPAILPSQEDDLLMFK